MRLFLHRCRYRIAEPGFFIFAGYLMFFSRLFCRCGREEPLSAGMAEGLAKSLGAQWIRFPPGWPPGV
jgi:hypothetical protein